MSSAPLADGPVPKHVQLRQILERSAREDLGVHGAVGSERALMARYGVSRATVRVAVGQLVNENVLYRVHGKGTFVAPERVDSQLHLASFTEDMRRRGLEPLTRLLGVTLLEGPPAQVASALSLRAGDRVWHVERLRIAGGEPMALEASWFPEATFPDLDRYDLAGSIYTLFSETYGLGVDTARQTVWAESPDPRQIELLRVPAGSPVLVFRRTSSADGVAVEHTVSWYRGDRYQVHMSLDREMSPDQLPNQGGR